MQITGARIGRAVSLVTIATWAGKIGALAAAFIIFRTFSPETYGLWRFVLAFYVFIMGWMAAPVSVITTEAIRDREQTGSGFEGRLALKGYFRLLAFLGVVLSIAGFIFRDVAVEQFHLVRMDLYLIGIGVFFAGILRLMASSYIQYGYSFRAFLRMQAAESFSYPIFIFLFVIVWPMGIAGVAWASLVSTGLSLLAISTLLLSVRHSLPSGGIKRELRALFRIFRHHGKWAIFTDISKSVLDFTRLGLIRALFGDAGVGIFSLADSLIGHVTSLISLGQPVSSAMPNLLHDKPALKRTMTDVVKFGSLAYAISIVISWIGLPFLPWLFPKYEPATWLYFFMSFALFVGGLTTMMNALFPALRWQKPLFFFSAAKLLILVITLPLFATLGFIPAVAFEFVFSSFFFAAVRFIWLRRELPETPSLRELLTFSRSDWGRARDLIKRFKR